MSNTSIGIESRSAFLGASATLLLACLVGMAPHEDELVSPLTNLPRAALTVTCNEARTPISSLPYTIDAPGSYFVTKRLTGTAGQHGIIVDADDVTLDLNGYSLTGVPGSLDGINFDAGNTVKQNILVLNGTVRGWGKDGVGGTTTVPIQSRYQGLRSIANGENGLFIGDGSIIQDCTAQDNGNNGIITSGEGTITNCVARNNMTGFSVNNGSVVRGCVAFGNTQYGFASSSILGGRHPVFSQCNATGNGTTGFSVEDGGLLVNSVAHGNGGVGIFTRDSTVLGCTSNGNSGGNCDDDLSSLILDSLGCP